MAVEGSVAAESWPTEQTVAILDSGAQYGKVIDRRVRALGVKSVILALDTPFSDLKDYGAIIITGGPESVYAKDSPHPDPKTLEGRVPLLGICYGMGLINQAYGGSMEQKDTREDGQFTITVDPSAQLFAGLKAEQQVLLTHGDSAGKIAPGFSVTATSGDLVAGIEHQSLPIHGVQFHPEVDLTEHGMQILGNFLFKVARLEADYVLEDRMEIAIQDIRQQVGNRQVLAFASGGVDSTVCVALLAKALRPEQIHVVHVDTGFMRADESALVQKALRAAGIDMQIIDAADQFFAATTKIKGKQTPPLHQVTDPEIKRAIIGDTFMKVHDRVVAELGLDPEQTVLAQGTLRPDLIESASHLASGKAAVIKSHHNDSGLVRELRDKGRVIEPLKDYHKDEVRELGVRLGLPSELVWRQPFPGPGLAIRLLCAEKPFTPPTFAATRAALQEFASDDIAVYVLPIRTVGVQGDGRSYKNLAAISGAADWSRLFAMAREIPKHVHDVNRVVYVLGDKLGAVAPVITRTHPTPEAVEQLRQADRHVNDVLRTYGLEQRLSQVPVISFPIGFGQAGNRSIAIRPFITNDFMTGLPAVPGRDLPLKALQEMADRILTIPGISRVAYDLTSKPPGTTEWE